MVAGAVWGRRGRRGEGPLVSETREEELGSGRQRLPGCVGACERERNGPGGLAGPVLMLGQIGGAWPFSFLLLLFFFCFNFLN